MRVTGMMRAMMAGAGQWWQRSRLALCVALCIVTLSAPMTASQAWACSGAGTPCFTGVGLPGTCDTAGVCIQEADPDGTCTSDSQYDITMPTAGQGIVATIVKYIKNALAPIGQQLFSSIVSDSGFTAAVKAAIILYVAIYGVLFGLGMVQVTVADFAMRIFKMGIVATMLNGLAWTYFSATFIPFFNDGTDSLITQFGSIVVGGNSLGGEPFDWIDQAIVTAVSTKMLITIMATATTGPYGFIVVLILMLSMWTFIKAMLNALWVYLMALVLRTLLFGLAPIFFACILFTRSRHLFDGWLNQVLNSCLQPIFLFAFFAFFVQLIKSCLDQIVALRVCWTEWAETIRGTPFSEHYWRFAVYDGNLGLWVPFDGIWDFAGPVGASGPVHPVGIMLPLTMWILSDIATRFNEIVVQIAKDIAGAATDFKLQGRGFFEGGSSGAGGGGADGAAKGNPGGKPKGGARTGPPGSSKPPVRGTKDGVTFDDVKRRFEQFGMLANQKRGGPGDKP